MGLTFIFDTDPLDFILAYKRQMQRRHKVTIMRRIPHSGWPPLLECKVCGATIHAETAIGNNGIPKLAWGAMNDCPRGCSKQALLGLMLAKRQAREDAKAELRKRRGCR